MQQTTPIPTDTWETELLRVSLFLQTPPSEPSSLYIQVTGESPENESQQRIGSVAIYNASSPFGEGVLELQVQSNRIDWVYGAPPVLTAEVPYFSAGNFPRNSEAFFIR